MWKAVQRYDDGEEAAWIGPPDSDNPAAVTTVSASAPRQNAGGEGSAPAADGDETAPAAPAPAAAATEDGGTSGTLGLIFGAAGLALGAAALSS